MLATEPDLTSIVDRFQGVKILVVGDVILDIYRVANATRISPEAPVPILLNPTTEYRLGGAAAVAAMCAALGADVTIISLVGIDANGNKLRELAIQQGISWHVGLVSSRQTTTKERICGVASGRHRQQLSRIDCEDTSDLSPPCRAILLDEVRLSLCQDAPDVILLSDYAKGICFPELVHLLINSGVETLVDPPARGDWSEYLGASCLVPNRQEAAGRVANQQLSEAEIVKLDQDGCQVNDFAANETRLIRSQARAVHDVTGAGDQFLAVLGLARAVGASWFEAATLANSAAGLQVERHGCVPVTLQELTETLAGSQ